MDYSCYLISTTPQFFFVCTNKDVCDIFFFQIPEFRISREMIVTGAMQFNAEIQAASAMLNDGISFTLIVICSSVSEGIEK